MDKAETITTTIAKNMCMTDWATEIHQLAVEKGWWNESFDEGTFDPSKRNVGEILLLACSELTEAFEEWRNGRKLTEVYYPQMIDNANSNDLGKPEGFPIELADCFIRLLDNCAAWEIDIEEMIRIKHNYNLTRPYRHGGKKA